MQSFKTFRNSISEAAGGTLDKVRAALSVFPMPTKRGPIILEHIAVLERGLADNSIWNSEFNDAKLSITRALESAFDAARNEELYSKAHAIADQDARSKFYNDYDSGASFSITSVKKLIAHFTKHSVQMPKSLKIVQGLEEFKFALDRLKPVIQKGRKPKEVPADTPQGFRKPAISYDAQKEIGKFLSDAASDVRADLEAAIRKQTESRVKLILAAPITDRKTYLEWVKKNPQLQLIAQKVWTPATDRYDAKFIVNPKFDEKTFVIGEAVRIANDILAQFVSKNTSKLALILNRKGGSASHKILTNRVRENVLENEMFFTFADGSSFKIYSKVEYAYSPNGKLFMRMPTRFTDVTLADGTKMKGAASEERMITEF
jgi:hypothetical protein